MPLVSVLMPTYKQEQFVERAIASLLAQELTDWELIMVDDGSPDGTEQRASRFLADERIAYYCLSENRGLGAALNAGLELGMAQLRESVWSQRYLFTFDHHAPGLARYVRTVIGTKQEVAL